MKKLKLVLLTTIVVCGVLPAAANAQTFLVDDRNGDSNTVYMRISDKLVIALHHSLSDHTWRIKDKPSGLDKTGETKPVYSMNMGTHGPRKAKEPHIFEFTLMRPFSPCHMVELEQREKGNATAVIDTFRVEICSNDTLRMDGSNTRLDGAPERDLPGRASHSPRPRSPFGP